MCETGARDPDLTGRIRIPSVALECCSSRLENLRRRDGSLVLFDFLHLVFSSRPVRGRMTPDSKVSPMNCSHRLGLGVGWSGLFVISQSRRQLGSREDQDLGREYVLEISHINFSSGDMMRPHASEMLWSC